MTTANVYTGRNVKEGGREYDPGFANSALPKYAFNAKELDEESGMYYYEARYYQPPVFVSRDPMFEKYFWMSPYAYCANNPMKYVDPSGCDIVVTGDDADEAVAQLNNNFSKNFVVTRNEDGTLSYTGKAKTRAEMLVQMAIDDDKITVNVEASNSNSFVWPDGSVKRTTNGGGYGGNKYENGKVNTYQKVCPQMLEMYDRSVGDMVPGETMLHEIAESYYGGMIALQNKQSSPMAGVPGSTYDAAHKDANNIAWGNRMLLEYPSDKLYISGYSQTKVGGKEVYLPNYKMVEYERCR